MVAQAPETLANMRWRIPPEHSRLYPLTAVLIAAVALLPTLRFAWHHVSHVQAWEPDFIARAIVSGHGFSFPGNEAWLRPRGDPSSYFPTAWADPVFTYILAGAHWLFGPHAYAAVYVFFGLCLVAILYGVYRIGRSVCGPGTAVLAVALTAANPALNRSYFSDISNTASATLAIVIAAYAAVSYLEHRSPKRLIVAGATTGLAVLACPTVQYYAIALAGLLVYAHWGDHPQRWVRPAIFLGLVLAVLAPWTIRNYAVFHQLVPVRSGGGQIAWVGTVGASATFSQTDLPAPWQSNGPRDAVRKLRDHDKREQMHRYQFAYMAAHGPADYEAMNEAQRDSEYMKQVVAFIHERPKTLMALAIAKFELFAERLGPYGVVTLALGLAGAALSIPNRSSWPLTLLVLSYCAPFVLVIPYFARYRAPIEPILTILAAIAVRTCFVAAARRWRDFPATKS